MYCFQHLVCEDRSKAASSVDSFNANAELQSLEERLKMKLVDPGGIQNPVVVWCVHPMPTNDTFE